MINPKLHRKYSEQRLAQESLHTAKIESLNKCLPEPDVVAQGCNPSSLEAERQEEVQGRPGI